MQLTNALQAAHGPGNFAIRLAPGAVGEPTQAELQEVLTFNARGNIPSQAVPIPANFPAGPAVLRTYRAQSAISTV